MESSTNILHKDLSSLSSIKIGVLSDTHSFIDPNVLQHLNGCDAILHAGDIGNIDVIQQLKQVCPTVVSVRGNNDTASKWPVSEHNDLDTIPELAHIKLPGGNITLIHGDQYFSATVTHDKMRQDFASSKAVVYGHSHIMVSDKTEDPWMLNPGAAGRTRTKGGASCLIIAANQQEWNVSEYKTREVVE